MKANMMRTPLIKSAVVLLVFVLLVSLTSAPGGSVLGSVGQIISGAFWFVWWVLAMAIGLAVCIAVLIGIFLFAVSLVNKETAAAMYAGIKRSVVALCAPICSCLSSLKCQEASCAPPPVQAVADGEQLKDEMQVIIATEIKKVTDNQQVLSEQFVSLNAKMQSMEDKSSGFAAAGQLESIAGEIANSAKALGAVQGSVVTLEGKLGNAVQQLQAITPEKMLGDIPARLASLEQRGDVKEFDPQPLTESLQILQKEVEELKKKNTGSTRAKKKA